MKKVNKHVLTGIILLSFLFLLAIFGPLFSSHPFLDIHLELKNLPPCLKFWCGTDDLGRDLFTRCCYGARISLSVGIISAFLDVLIGIIWGTLAAYLSGVAEEIMMRICDILYCIPLILIVIMLLVILGPGFGTIILSLTLTGWVNMARIARSQSLQILEMDFIKAAYSLGASKRRIIFRHLIPNMFGTVITSMTFTIPTAIFYETFLSFLGLGIQAPFASLGVMINDSLSALRYFPWRLFFPSLLISLTILGFNLLGDGLRDTLDPRLRKET